MSENVRGVKIGVLLETRGLASKSQIEMALTKQRQKRRNGDLQLLGSILVDLGHIKEEDLHSMIRETLDAPMPGKEYSFIAARMREILGDETFEDAEKRISTEKGHDHVLSMLDRLDIASFESQKKFIFDYMRPFCSNLIIGDKNKVVMAPGDKYIYEDEPVEICFIPSVSSQVRQVILSRAEWEDITGVVATQNLDDRQVAAEDELPYSIEMIFTDACDAGASDVHIIYKDNGYYIAFRINGDYVIQKKYTEYVLSLKKGHDLVYYIKHRCGLRSNVNASERRKIQDGKFSLDVCGGIDLRVVVIPDGQHEQEEVVVRIFHRKNIKPIPLTELGYYPDDIEILQRAFRRKNGLMVICGVTGSGKTTLGNQLLLSDTKRKIETFEDPIEYSLPNPNICQHQISIPKQEDIKLGYRELVKAGKRADPDVFYLAEIRKDMELFDALVEAAYAGQLVIGTIHVNSAFMVPAAMTAIFKADRYSIATLILYTLNQDLVKQLCSCKLSDVHSRNIAALKDIRDELPYAVKKRLDDFVANPKDTFVANPKGCAKCNHTGYLGQTPIYEYFYPDADFVQWMMSDETKITKYDIELKACDGDSPLGVNKLHTFIRKLEDGLIDVSDETLKSLI